MLSFPACDFAQFKRFSSRLNVVVALLYIDSTISIRFSSSRLIASDKSISANPPIAPMGFLRSCAMIEKNLSLVAFASINANSDFLSASSANFFSVIFSLIAIKLTIFLLSSRIGAIMASSQYWSPFFFLFRNSPCHVSPDRMVFHILS